MGHPNEENVQPPEKKDPPIAITDGSTTISPEQLARHGLEMSSSGYIQWRRDCKDHPRNWSAWRKFYDTSTVMFFEFYT